MYLHWMPGSPLDLLRQLVLELDLQPAHYRGDLVRQDLAGHRASQQLPLLLNFDMDSSHYLTLLLVGQPPIVRITWKDSRGRNSTPIWRINSRPPASPSRCLTTRRGMALYQPKNSG
jgi:hypothetical protein